MLQEFKAFAMRGNVVDMAVGIVIGAAFSAIVSGLVDQILMPIIGLLTGGADFSNLYILLRAGVENPGPYPSLEAAKEAGAVVVGFGVVVNAVVHFLIVAFALFLVVKAVNRMKREEPPAPAPEPSNEEKLLTEIRDLLAKR
jgi:large conductance mechanosensitive channel